MKRWQWAVIAIEATLLFGVLGTLAWLLLNPVPATPPPVAAQAAAPSPTLTPTDTPSPTIWPTSALSTSPPTRTPQPTNTRVIPREKLNQAAIEQIERQVAQLRDLQPRAAVPVEFLTRAQMLDHVRASYAAEQAAADQELTLYRALGLIRPGGRAERESTLAAIASGIAGYYDAQDKRLYVVSDLENLGAEEKATLAHEFTHALQDQQFDLTRYQRRATTTDARLAASSVAEGDATLVMSMVLYGATTQSEWDYLAYRASFSDPGTAITATHVSTRAGQIAYFPYLYGAQFILRLWQDGKGWAQVNHAYADPPQSTLLILHPERYLTQLATPVPVALPNLGPALGPGWTLIKSDTLGEFVTSVHLDEFLNAPARARQAADGWEGDQLALWQASNDQLAFAWRIAWNTPRDAGEFFDAYADLLRRRVGANARVERESADTRWYSGAGGSGLIQTSRAGDQTLVLWTPDKTTTERLLALFK